MLNFVVLDWIKPAVAAATTVLSVCTGALILGKAGLLEKLSATTHHGAIDLLREVAPRTRVLSDQRVVDNGKIVLAAGVSSGIEGALHVVARRLGPEVAAETASYIEYPYYRPQQLA